MQLLSRLFDRALPALLMASSVVLLSAGLFSYAPVGGDSASPSVLEPGDPNFPAPTAGTASPTEVAQGSPPPASAESPRPTSSIVLSTASPAPSPSASGSALPGESPTASAPVASGSVPPATVPPATVPPATAPPPTDPGATATPGGAATPPPPQPPSGRARATRVVVPSLDIDLAVVPGDLVVPGNRNFYPLCNVAQYLMEYSQPGEAGTTYLYGHARTGMFLPLLEQSQRNNGRGMIGSLVEVYTSDNRLHLYEIYIVKRHATNLDLAHQLPPAGHQLILQTSEGPRGTVPKLQVAARPLSVVPADPAAAHPHAQPRVCR